MNGPFYSTTPEELMALRLQLLRNGYHPIPVRGKAPALANWQNCSNGSPEMIQRWARSLRDATNTGLLTGPIAGVDIDVLDDELSTKLVALAFKLLGLSSLRRIGRAPKVLLLYRMESSHAKIATPDLFFGDNPADKETKAKVEVLLVGQQVVVHGIHPDTRAPYVWTDRSPFDTPIGEVPLVTAELLRRFVNEAEQILRNAGARTEQDIKGNRTDGNHREGAADTFQQANKPSRERVEELLAYIPNDRSYDDWVNIGFAIYDALSAGGCDIWEKWSATSEKNEPDFTAKKWPSFAPEKRSANKRAITYKTLYWEARKNGWREADNESVLNELNEKYFVTKEGGKTWVVTFELEHKRRILTYMKFGDFTNLYMNRLVRVEVKNKTPQYIPAGKWWLQHPQRRQYDGLIFEPGNPAPTMDNRFNLWRGWGVEAKPGDWSLMREHIRLVLASGDTERFEYIMRWLAWAVQNPGRQAEVALVFKGKRGTGKGTLGNCMLTLFGQHSRHVSSAKHLAGNFNAHLRDTCFLFGDECYWPGDKQAEGTLKRLLTEPTLLIEAKGRDAVTVPNHLHVLLSSNEDWVVPAGENERRFFMCHVSEA
jgi:hypothetical protein